MESSYRSRRILPLAIVGGTFAALPLALAFGPHGGSLGSRAEALALGVGWAGLCWLRFARVGVYARREGVRVVNLFWTYRLKLSDVMGFRFAPSPITSITGWSGWVDRFHGPPIPIYGITGSNRAVSRSHREGVRLISELTSWLIQAKGGH